MALLRDRKKEIMAASIIAVLIFIVVIGWLFFQGREPGPGDGEEEIPGEIPGEDLTDEERERRIRRWEELIPGQPIPEEQRMCLQIPPLVISLGSINIPSINLNEFIGLPATTSIPWPESLKKISLTEEIKYELPTIPLSNLNYSKEVSIKIPGFQSLSKANLTAVLNFPYCVSRKPSGGNPCIGQLEVNLARIQQIKANIEEASKNIINILE
jgi:hypothetical protein